MFPIVRSLVDRFKTLFLSHAVLEIEADLIAASAERKADLLRRAEQYEKDGLASIAQELRTRADALSAEKPLDSVAAAIAHLRPEVGKPNIQAPAPEHTKKKASGIVTDVRRAAARNLWAAFRQLEPAD